MMTNSVVFPPPEIDLFYVGLTPTANAGTVIDGSAVLMDGRTFGYSSHGGATWRVRDRGMLCNAAPDDVQRILAARLRREVFSQTGWCP